MWNGPCWFVGPQRRQDVEDLRHTDHSSVTCNSHMEYCWRNRLTLTLASLPHPYRNKGGPYQLRQMVVWNATSQNDRAMAGRSMHVYSNSDRWVSKSVVIKHI